MPLAGGVPIALTANAGTAPATAGFS